MRALRRSLRVLLPRRLPRAALVATVLISGTAPPGTRDLVAQDVAQQGIFLPTGGELEVLWQRLAAAREAGQWETVVDGWMAYAEDIRKSERNVTISGGGRIALGVRAAFPRLLEGMPTADLERLRRRVDALLRTPWEEAGMAGGEERGRLRHLVLRDFPMASIREEALREEIAERFERGDAASARKACEALATSARASPVDAIRARMILETLLVAEGRQAEVEANRERLASLRGDPSLAAADPSLAARLSEFLSRPPSATPAEAGALREAQVSALDPRRTSASGETGYRLGTRTWSERMADVRVRGFVRERAREAPGGNVALSDFPAARDGWMVFQHSGRASARELSGLKRTWSIRYESEAPGPGQVLLPLVGRDRVLTSDASQLRALRRTTGEVLWALDFRYDRETKKLVAETCSPAFRRVEGEEPPPAEETASEDSKEASPEIEEIPDSLIGPPFAEGGMPPGILAPVPTVQAPIPPVVTLTPARFFEDDVIVGMTARVDQETLAFLARVDAEGRASWISFLGSASGGVYLGLGGHASLPFVRDGVVYFLSNLGWLSAVDAVDGTLLWSSEYAFLSAKGKREALRRDDRWHPHPLAASSGWIVAAPQDAAHVFAFRADTGEVAWTAPRNGGTMLLGADDRAVYVLGRELVALAVAGEAAGTPLWRSPWRRIPASGIADESASLDLSGRPVLLDGTILVPTRSALVGIAALDGRELWRTLWEFGAGGGNLVQADGHLGIANPEGFLAYGDREEERAEVLASSARGPEVFLRTARFHSKNLEFEPTLQALERWTTEAPAQPIANSPLDHLQLDLAEMIAALVHSGDAGPKAAALLHYRVLLETKAPRKVRAAVELGERLEMDGDPTAALGAYHEALFHDTPETEYAEDGWLPAPSTAVIKERIRALRSRNDPGRFMAQDEASLKAFDRARRRGNPQAFVEILRLHPLTPGARKAALELAALYKAREGEDAAIGVLEGLLEDFPDAPEAVGARVDLTELLLGSGREEEARATALEALRRQAEVQLPRDAGKTRVTVAQAIAAIWRRAGAGPAPDPALETAPAGTLAGSLPAASFDFPVRMAWRSPAELQATSRSFLEPTGRPPSGLAETFYWQSLEVIEARDLHTGLPSWTVRLDLIPGFEFSRAPHGFRFPRSGPTLLSGAFVGDLLVLHDDANLFALEAARGIVKWHVPVGAGTAGDAEPLRQLRERLRGVLVSEQGVFATTGGRAGSRTLRRIGLDGVGRWKTELDYEPASYPPILHGDSILVHSQRPFGLVEHAAGDGRKTGSLDAADGFERPIADPEAVGGGKALFAFSTKLGLFDLAERRFDWTYSRPRSTVEGISWDPAFPDECIVFINRPQNWPAVVCVSLADGTELWRWEKFPARQTNFHVVRDKREAFVVHGEDSWSLLSLRTRRGPDGWIVEAGWPREIKLGTFASGLGPDNLLLARNSIIFSDPTGSISVYDRNLGVEKNAPAGPLSAFLVEKGGFASTLRGGKLILLTDGGDAAFETAPPDKLEGAGLVDMLHLRDYRARPENADAAVRLALDYFRGDHRATALRLLDRALRGEPVLDDIAGKTRMLLGYLQDGIKEEHMKDPGGVPRIGCRRMKVPPAIDGELSDPWDMGTRVVMRAPRFVGAIPGPGPRKEWDGEEDLSAVLYTGWDDTYFYFALDVTDDVLYPYDRDAEIWKGDCLIVGLDPTGDGGYWQRGNDQLMTLALTIPKPNKKDKKKEDGKEAGEEGEDEDEEKKPEGLFSVKRKDDDTGAVYEIGLPWASFRAAFRGQDRPQEGYAFGLSLLVADDDTGDGATKTLSMNPCHLLPRSQKSTGIWRFIVPYFFPRVRLE